MPEETGISSQVESFQIQVSFLSGYAWHVEGDKSWTGATLKRHCAQRLCTPASDIFLVHAGVTVDEDSFLLNVFSGSLFHVQLVRVPKRRLLSTGEDRRLLIWDIELGHCVREVIGSTRCINCVVVDGTFTRAISGGYEINTSCWDLEAGVQCNMLSGCSETVNCIEANSETERAVIGYEDGMVLMWEFSMAASAYHIIYHIVPQSAVNTLSVCWAMDQLFCAGDDAVIRLLDIGRRELLLNLHVHNDAINTISVDWSSNHLLSGCDEGIICLSNFEGNLVEELLADTNEVRDAHHGQVATGVHCLRMEWLSKQAVSGHRDAIVRIWDIEDGSVLRELKDHGGAILSLDVDWSARLAFSGSRDTSIRMWSLDSGEVVKVLRGHRSSVRSVVV